MSCKYCRGEAALEIYKGRKGSAEYTGGILKLIDQSGTARAEKWQYFGYCPHCGRKLMGGAEHGQ